jgi:hypothetical protein
MVLCGKTCIVKFVGNKGIVNLNAQKETVKTNNFVHKCDVPFVVSGGGGGGGPGRGCGPLLWSLCCGPLLWSLCRGPLLWSFFCSPHLLFNNGLLRFNPLAFRRYKGEHQTL